VGLFGWTDHSREIVDDLTDWGMRPKYAEAFAKAYAKPLSVGLERIAKGFHGADAGTRLGLLANGGLLRMAEVSQAIISFSTDLRRGVHVGTNVERAVWAILIGEIANVEGMDGALAVLVSENYERVFPGLLDEVFETRDESPEAPSDFEMASKVASLVEAQIRHAGLAPLMKPGAKIAIDSGHNLGIGEIPGAVASVSFNGFLLATLAALIETERDKGLSSNPVLRRAVDRLATATWTTLKQALSARTSGVSAPSASAGSGYHMPAHLSPVSHPPPQARPTLTPTIADFDGLYADCQRRFDEGDLDCVEYMQLFRETLLAEVRAVIDKR
jgi:hypothetical protein